MADTSRVDFTRASADRIAKVVRKVEASGRDGTPLSFEPHHPALKQVRYVQWTGTWLTGETHTITFMDTTVTAVARNAFAGVNTGKGFASKHSGTWHLFSVNLYLQPGMDSTSVQFIGHETTNGILQWYSVHTCSTAA